MLIEIERILDVKCHLDDIDVVIFDMDDTLYPEKAYIRSGYRAVAKCFPTVKDMEEKLWVEFEAGRLAIDNVLRAEKLLTEENFSMALDAYRKQRPDILLYDGVRDLLCGIRKSGKKLGLITDGRPDGQWAKIDVLGLWSLMDEIIVTDDLGGIEYRKPNDISFRTMQARFDSPFEKMAYIGDNVKKDFVAPTNLGMKCIWFRNSDGVYYLEK